MFKITDFRFWSFLLIAGVTSAGGLMALQPTAICGQGPSPPKAKVPPFSLVVEVMSDPGGTNLNSFMRRLYSSIKEKAVSSMPKTVFQGDQGMVAIRVQVQKDGTVAEPEFPKFEFRSGKKSLDEHALAAVRSAAPFDHLPESFPTPNVELKLTFCYNLPPPRP